MKIIKILFILLILGLVSFIGYQYFLIRKQQNNVFENSQKLTYGMYIDDVTKIMGTPSTRYEPKENPDLSPGFDIKLTYDTNKKYGNAPIILLFNRWHTLYEITIPSIKGK